MSSTNRGNERERDDFYATPAWVTNAILPHLLPPVPIGEGFDVLDPCCGEGAILDVLRSLGAGTFGIELDEGRAVTASTRGHSVVCTDSLSAPWPDVPLIITNPPFCLAQEFFERAIACARPHGTVAMLLRLAFIESDSRYAFHAANPCDVYAFSNRPSFTANGKSDSCAYAWFVHGPGRGNRFFVLPDRDPNKKPRPRKQAKQ